MEYTPVLVSKLIAARLAYGVDRAVQANLAVPATVVAWELATDATKVTWLRYITVYNEAGTVPTLGSDVHRTSAFSALMRVLIPAILPGNVLGRVKTYAVSPTTTTKAVAGTQQLTITTPLDADGNAATGTYTYASSNTNKATVNASGLITAVQSGSATVTVTEVNSGVTHTCVVTVS
jgi:hypothetical protein